MDFLEATPGFEPGNKGFADLCLTTWLCRHMLLRIRSRRGRKPAIYNKSLSTFGSKTMGTMLVVPSFSGADYGDRTRHLDLGKVALYQMS